MSGIDGWHGAESLRGEVTLDNLLEMWQSIPGINPGGSDVTRKVIRAKDQRNTTFEMGLRPIEPCHWAQLPDLPQYGQRISETRRLPSGGASTR